MIRVRALSLELGRCTVLDNIELDLEPGRVTAVIGANGAGKTSLMRAIAGLVRPQSGTVEIDGRAIGAFDHRERARLIGYLPQDGDPAWNLAARELVSLGRLPHRGRLSPPSLADEAAIDAAMTATDTARFAARAIGTLSGGEKARVKMARVLAGDPRWILADEPLANLDPPHQRDMLALFRQAASAGTGVLTVLHQLDAAARADDVVILAQGKLIAHGPAREVLTPANLEKAFGMPFDIVRHGGRIAILARS